MHRLLIALLLAFHPCWGADAAAPPNGAFEPVEAVPVVVWNRTVAELRVGIDGLSIAERAARIQHRILALSDAALAQPIVLRQATVDGIRGQMVHAGSELIMTITDGDLGPGQDRDAVAQAVVERLRQVFDARIAQHRPSVLLMGSLWSLLATLVLVIALWLVRLACRRLVRRVDAQPLQLPRMAGLDPAPVVRGGIRLALHGVGWIAAGVLVYAWLTTVLLQFPYTRPLATVLGSQLWDLVRLLLTAVVSSLPGLGMVAVIVLLTRLAARALDALFTSVEDGTLEIGWLEPDTAKATRRIAGIILWLFAITVAYPYVPGSSSDAFKGVSVFAGLLLTLGSSGLVNQMMSGLVVVYSRMMRTGDMIAVGDITGRVTELGFLSTKVRTPLGHEVTMPNAILVGASVSNFSRTEPHTGPVIACVVTIGYDTPWRQVHAMLALAASRTPGVAADAKPEILQTALSDFYVEYQLRCRIERVEDRVRVLSDLHAQVQDAFNEFGVQIMSPHFIAQPAQPVVVPPAARAPAPAQPEPPG